MPLKPLAKVNFQAASFTITNMTPPTDKGSPYEFHSAYQLVEDFFIRIDEVIRKRENRG